MISIVVTAFHEPRTIGRAIESIIGQKISEKYELFVSSPDNETIDVVKKYISKNPQIKIFKDPGKGKSYALNLLLSKLKGEILIFTDGDVFLSSNSIMELLKPFSDKKVGCVSGRPVPIEKKSNKYGFWAHFLFDSANELRKKSEKKYNFVECSGYLFAFRNGIIKKIPLDVAEDSIIPHIFYQRGYKVSYSSSAEVYVKNVNNINDWIKQKSRTSKAHENLDKYVNAKKFPRMKNFFNELAGVWKIFVYPSSFEEFLWMVELFLARLFMWFIVFYQIKIKRKNYSDNWERINSTK